MLKHFTEKKLRRRFGTLGSDGVLYWSLANYEEVDITPHIPNVNYFSFQFGAPQKYTLTHQTEQPALTDTNRARLNLGVGEYVDFSGMPGDTTWSATAGGITTNNEIIVFTAPSNAPPGGVSATVIATCHGQSLSNTFTVFPPTGYDSAHTFITNSNGACYLDQSSPFIYLAMNVRVCFAPLNVSLNRVKIMEVGGDATNIWGWFTNPVATATSHNTNVPIPKRLRHRSDTFTPLTADNFWVADDHCGGCVSEPLPQGSPWIPGGFSWIIPANWTIDGLHTNPMTGWGQVYSVNGNGTWKIAKFNKWVQCTTAGAITTGTN